MGSYDNPVSGLQEGWCVRDRPRGNGLKLRWIDVD